MPGKKKVSITINGDVYERLAGIGIQYGLGFSNMVERSVRCYLAEFGDLEEALYRSKNEKEHLTLEETERFIELGD